MRYTLATILLAALTSTAFAPSAWAQAQPGPANPPVTGTIKSVEGSTLTVNAASGMTVTAQLSPATRITVSVPKTLADIKPGDFIASGGTRGPDGKLRANEIRIFSAPGGEGQFPMTQPGQTMTNATVKQVMTDAKVEQVGKTGTIKLSFHGAGAPGAANCTGRAADAPGGAGTGCTGETEFEVPANVPIVAQIPGDASMLKPGARISLVAAGGNATRITISQ